MKKSICILLVIILCATTFDFTAYATENTNAKNERIEYLHNEISLLNFETDKNYKAARFNQLKSELEKLDVEFITDPNLSDNSTNVIPTPVQNGILWTSKTEIVHYNGTSHTVQTLTCMQDPSSSTETNLYFSKTIVTEKSPNKTAAATNAIKVVASTAIASINGYAAAAITIYDFLSGIISGLKTTSIINNVKATYMVDGVTSIKFVFVKDSSESDDTFLLSFVTNSCNYLVDTRTSSLKYDGVTVIPSSTFISKTINAKGLKWDNSTSSGLAYFNALSTASASYVGAVSLYGSDDYFLFTNYPYAASSINAVY